MNITFLNLMIIRQCRAEDIEDVIRIENLSFKYPYPSLIFYEYIEKIFFVAEKDGKIVGYIIADNSRHLIVSIAVHPDYRRQGIGKALMERALKYMKGYAYLQVRVNNKDAIEFYRKLGFYEKEIIKSYYIDGEDAILMFKKID